MFYNNNILPFFFVIVDFFRNFRGLLSMVCYKEHQQWQYMENLRVVKLVILLLFCILVMDFFQQFVLVDL